MLNRTIRAIAALAIVAGNCAAQYYRLDMDTQSPDEQHIIPATYEGNTPFLRVAFYNDDSPVNLSNAWSMSFWYSKDRDTALGVQIPGVWSSTNVCDFVGETNVFFKADKYYFSVMGINLSGNVKTFGVGTMFQFYDPATDTNLQTQLSGINYDWWTNNVGAQVFSNKAAITTLRIDVNANTTNIVNLFAQVASNDTELASIQAQVTSNDTDIAGALARIGSNETAIATNKLTAGEGLTITSQVVRLDDGVLAGLLLASNAVQNFDTGLTLGGNFTSTGTLDGYEGATLRQGVAEDLGSGWDGDANTPRKTDIYAAIDTNGVAANHGLYYLASTKYVEDAIEARSTGSFTNLVLEGSNYATAATIYAGSNIVIRYAGGTNFIDGLAGGSGTGTDTVARAIATYASNQVIAVRASTNALRQAATNQAAVYTRNYTDNATNFTRGATNITTGTSTTYNKTTRLLTLNTNGWSFGAAESDPVYGAWVTNSTAGTTNAILPDGTLADISSLLGQSSGGGDLQTTLDLGNTATNPIVIGRVGVTNILRGKLQTGSNTVASGTSSSAHGHQTTASGFASSAKGCNTTASGHYSSSEGTNTVASGLASHAEGRNNTASGLASHAEGYGSVASGDYSHAEGTGDATATGAHAEGNSFAYGNFSHAEGSSKAYGSSSHAEGNNTIASNSYSHSEGDGTKAFGYASHAEGAATRAYGDMSHAAGYNASAIHAYSYLWSDGSYKTSSLAKQFTVYAGNGIRLLGGTTDVSVLRISNTNVTSGQVTAWDSIVNTGGTITNKSFLDLMDTPDTYTGSGDKFLKIGTDETNIEAAVIGWTDVSKTGSDLADIETRSHTNLQDIGTLTHDQLDAHIETDAMVHSSATNLVQTTGNQSIAGIKTFTQFPLLPSGSPSGDNEAANKSYVDALAVGLTWKSPVQSIGLTTPPGASTNGYRYVVGTGAGGAWTNWDNYIAIWNDDEWTNDIPEAGWAVLELENNTAWTYTSTSNWLQFSGMSGYSASLGVKKIGNDFQADLTTNSGLTLVGNSLEVNVDGSTIVNSNGVLTMGPIASQVYLSTGIMNTAYMDVDLVSSPQTAQAWANMPNAETELFNNTYARLKLDLSTASRFRLCANQTVAGAAAASLRLQYSTNGTTFANAETGSVANLSAYAAGVKAGEYADLTSAARADVWLRLVGSGGNGSADPAWRQIRIQFEIPSLADTPDAAIVSVCTSNLTVNITTNDCTNGCTSGIQAILDAIPRFAEPGLALTINFAAGNYVFTNGYLRFSSFAWETVIIAGPPYAITGTNQTAILDFSGSSSTPGMLLNGNYGGQVVVQALRIIVGSNQNTAIGTSYNGYVGVQYCSMKGIGHTPYGMVVSNGGAMMRYCVMSGFTRDFVGAFCYAFVKSNQSGDDPAPYATYADNMGLIYVLDDNLTGTNYSTAGGITMPLEILELSTTNVNTELVLKPDGDGGVTWGTDTTGSGITGATATNIAANVVGSSNLVQTVINGGTSGSTGTISRTGGAMTFTFPAPAAGAANLDEATGTGNLAFTNAVQAAQSPTVESDPVYATNIVTRTNTVQMIAATDATSKTNALDTIITDRGYLTSLGNALTNYPAYKVWTYASATAMTMSNGYACMVATSTNTTWTMTNTLPNGAYWVSIVKPTAKQWTWTPAPGAITWRSGTTSGATGNFSFVKSGTNWYGIGAWK